MKARIILLITLLVSVFANATDLPVRNVSGTITGTQTWSADTVYLVTGDITIDVNVTLTIPPSTVIKFTDWDHSFIVNGRLDCNGTIENPVVFTSFKDDTYGGDSNNDGNASVPVKGDWGYIRFNTNANVKPIPFENCVIKYGGRERYYLNGNDYYPQILVNSSNQNYEDITIRNCNISDSYSIGIFVAGVATPTIENNTLSGAGTSIFNYYTSPIISSNQISNNTHGIRSEGVVSSPSKPSISNNTIENNIGYPLLQYGNAFPSYSGNTISNNTLSGIAVSGTIDNSTSATETWVNVENLDLPYVVVGDLTIGTNIILTIPASTVIKFTDWDHSLIVNGRLDCNGTAESPVVFTSFKDDTYGGDSNGDGNASVPVKGDWGYIRFNTNANVTPIPFENCVIKYGGRERYYLNGNDYYPQILVNSSNQNYEDITIRNCNISDSYSIGIFVAGVATPTIENNILSGAGTSIFNYYTSPIISSNQISNNTHGIRSEGVVSSHSKPSISNNTIENNIGYPLLQYGNAFPSYSGNTISNNTLSGIAVSGTIDNSTSATETWVNVENLDLPYVVVGDLTIGTNIILTIPALTVIKFTDWDHSLIVNGRLDCNGTAESPVVFTSFKDDTYGGDSNGDGNASTPAKGDWGYIRFNTNANVTPIPFENCVIKYGGRERYYLNGNDYYPQILVNSSNQNYEDITIRNCNISDSYSIGIFVAGVATPTIENNTLSGAGTSIFNYYTSPIISSNQISNNTHGIRSEGVVSSPSKPSISNNTIENNIGYPLLQYGNAFPSYSGNTISNNTLSGIAVSGTIDNSTSATETWVNVENLDLPYVVVGDLTIGTNIILTIPASTVMKFTDWDHSLIVNGRLDCNGTAESPVVFTSFKDDTYGGDSNGDGNASTPAKGDWGHIRFNTNANVTPIPFENCVIKYGGRERYYLNGNDYYPQILVNSSNQNYEDIIIRNCKLYHFYNTGIFCSNPQNSQNISNVHFLDGRRGIHFQNSTKVPAATITDCYFTEMSSIGIYAENSSLVMRYNTFFDNNYGIYTKGGESQEIQYSLFAEHTNAAIYIDGNNTEPVVQARNSTFKNNTSYHIHALNYANANSNIIDAEQNYFDETDSINIAAKMYDYNDNTGSPYIDFTPFYQAGDINPYCVADFDFSGRVDGFDLALLANSFGYSNGHEFFNGTVDIDNSERIDGLDLAYFGLRYGSSGPCERPNSTKSGSIYQNPNVITSTEMVGDNKYRIILSVENFNRVFGGNLKLYFGDADYTIEKLSFVNPQLEKIITKLYSQYKDGLQIGFYSDKTIEDGELLEILVSSKSITDVDIAEVQLIDSNEKLLLNTVTSIEKQGKINDVIKVYPNPFNEELFIRINSTTQGNLDIYNVSGKRIDQFRIEDNTTITYSGENLKSGVYILRFNSEKTSETIRIIKQ